MDTCSLETIRKFEGHSSFVTDIKCERELCRFYLSSSMDCSVRMWHKDMRDSVFILRTKGSNFAATFVPNDPLLLVTAGQGIKNIKFYCSPCPY